MLEVKRSISEVVNNPPPYPGGEDDGVVYVVENGEELLAIVGCRMIRRLGCDWPIEIRYQGDKEILLGSLRDVEVIRDSSHEDALVSALLLTRFERVLLLRANSYPVALPCRLTNELITAPFVYWEDPRHGPGRILDGVFLFDRPNAWRLIAGASELPSVPGYRDDYGTTWKWSVTLSEDPCSDRSLGPARFSGDALVCCIDGNPRIINRPVTDLKNGVRRPDLPFEEIVFELYGEISNVGQATRCDSSQNS